MIAAELTCPVDGAEVTVINVGRPQAGTRATSIVKCDQCRREFSVTATLRPVNRSVA